jgi:hypothetical protein
MIKGRGGKKKTEKPIKPNQTKSNRFFPQNNWTEPNRIEPKPVSLNWFRFGLSFFLKKKKKNWFQNIKIVKLEDRWKSS